MNPRTGRVGQVWEHVDPSIGLLLILRDGSAVEDGLDISGWDCFDLEEGVFDWLPDSCFVAPHWRRLA